MLEPQIKYENCEEIYAGPILGISNDAPLQMIPDNVMDRGSEICDPIGVSMRQKRSYEEHLKSMAIGNGAHTQPDPYVGHNYKPAPLMGGQNYYAVQQQQQQTPPTHEEAAKAKRQRRFETNILFQYPFFNLLEDWHNARTGESITAKCLSCRVTLRGHKNVSSNFIKHMKRLHPDLYKVYENYKLLKLKGWEGTPLEAKCSEQASFDANAFMEQLATHTSTVEDHNSTETSSTPPIDSLEVSVVEVGDEAGSKPNESTEAIPASGGPVRVVSQDRILAPKQGVAEVDLSTKTLQHMSELLDKKLSGFVTIAQLETERKTMMDLIESKLEEAANQSQAETASLAPTISQSTDVTMQSQIDALKLECAQLRDTVRRIQQSKQHLQEELQAVDRAVRQRKLFVRNMTLLQTEKPKQAAERLMREYLLVADVQIKCATLLNGAKKTKPNLLIELQTAMDAQKVFRNCGKLKNTGIVVEPALGPHALRRKHKLLVLRKEMLRRNAQLKVLVRNTELIVAGKQFYWDAVDGLCVAGDQLNEALDTDTGAVDTLKEATGLEMQEFLNVLKNYNVK